MTGEKNQDNCLLAELGLKDDDYSFGALLHLVFDIYLRLQTAGDLPKLVTGLEEDQIHYRIHRVI